MKARATSRPKAAIDIRPYVRDAAIAWPDTGEIAPEETWQRAHLPVAPLTFWLTVHEPGWLARTDVPLMVSRTRFYVRNTDRMVRRLPRARGPWALDSGGYTEVAKHRGWRILGARYVADVRRLRDEVGNLCWAAPQDWMCEGDVVAGTGLSIGHHQHLTVMNWIALRWYDLTLPIIPVLQGWTLDDYLRHRDHYHAGGGIDLTREPLVGVGTMCRRDAAPRAIASILQRLAREGLRCHAFGVKGEALAALFPAATTQREMFAEPPAPPTPSADSAAWSVAARYFAVNGRASSDQLGLFADAPRGARGAIVPGHRHGRDGQGSCANCLAWALQWRARLLARTTCATEAA